MAYGPGRDRGCRGLRRSYLLNLGTPDETNWQKSVNALADELTRGAAWAAGRRVSPGSAHMGTGEPACSASSRASMRPRRNPAGLPHADLVEGCGPGHGAGRTTSSISRLSARSVVQGGAWPAWTPVICLRPATTSAPEAYWPPWRSSTAWSEALQIRCFHFNGHESRFANWAAMTIGASGVGLTAFGLFLNDHNRRTILETEKSDGMHEDVENLRVLRGLIQ